MTKFKKTLTALMAVVSTASALCVPMAANAAFATSLLTYAGGFRGSDGTEYRFKNAAQISTTDTTVTATGAIYEYEGVAAPAKSMYVYVDIYNEYNDFVDSCKPTCNATAAVNHKRSFTISKDDYSKSYKAVARTGYDADNDGHADFYVSSLDTPLIS